jgi:inward rectifier potassium channel
MAQPPDQPERAGTTLGRHARRFVRVEELDLGFGAVAGRESRQRLLNRDGSFNVRRRGLRMGERVSLFHALLVCSNTVFLAVSALAFVAVNLMFAALFVLCGPGALRSTAGPGALPPFATAFFFSVHTLTTIGYGDVVPQGWAAHSLVAGESLLGLLLVAVLTGLVFARFSRPRPRVVFSRMAVVAPYRGITGLMIRLINGEASELVELRVSLVLTQRREDGSRSYRTLALERDQVAFLPLSWTVVHPIDQDSPLFGISDAELRRTQAEILVLLNAVDEIFSQHVHTRTSYLAEDVVYGRKFADMFTHGQQHVTVDGRRLNALEDAPLASEL